MNELIQALAAVAKPPWNYVLLIAAAIIVGLPRVMELRESLLKSRSNMRELEYEKLRLEVLLLQRQLKESARPDYMPEVVPGVMPDVVPELARELGTIRIDPRPPVASDVFVPPRPAPAKSPGTVRRFVMSHPGFGQALMWAVQIVLFPVVAMFAFATPGIVIAGYTDSELGLGVSLALALVYAALAGLSYWGFRSAGFIRRAVAA